MRRTSALVGAFVLTAGLTLGGTGVAFAAPDPGTSECDALVSGNADVIAALADRDEAATALGLLPATDPGFEEASALVATLGGELDSVRASVTAELCTGEEETTTPPAPEPEPDDRDCPDFATQADAQAHLDADTTDPDRLDADSDGRACEEFFAGQPGGDPAPTPEPDPATVALREQIASLECDDTYFADRGRISDTIAGRLGEPGTGELIGLLTDKDRELNYCIGEEPVDRNTVVTPLNDDDSTATVSGDQVREVPEGSIETGGV